MERYHFRNKRGTNVQVNLADTDYPESDEHYDLCLCHFTGAMFTRQDGVVLGGIIPQAPNSYLCHPLAADVRKRSARIFQDYEQNCNTCRHLERVPFERKSPALLMPGKCKHPSPSPLYPQDDGTILFHPDDCMLQPCYEPREV